MTGREILFNYVSGFSLLTEQEVDEIVNNANIQSFESGHLLLREGQVAKHCYFVLKGMVREYYLKDGEEKSTAFYVEGEPVNSFTSLTSGSPSKHFLVCSEDCVLTLGTQSLEAEMCERIPRLAQIIREEVERHTGIVKDQMANFMMSSPEERYIDLQRNKPALLQRVPQHQLASYIGVAPESLSRIRKRLLTKVQD